MCTTSGEPNHLSGRALASISWLDAHEQAKHSFRDQVVARWDLAPGSRVIDLGCGPGHWTRRLTHAIGPQGRVTGLDIADDLIAIARERHSSLIADGACEFAVRSIDRVDPELLADADVVIALNVLGYFDAPSSIIASIWPNLRSGARLIVRQFDYGCTLYSGIPFDLQCRVLSGLAQNLMLKPLSPPCHAFLGRELPSVFRRARIDNPRLTTDAIQFFGPVSDGTEIYLREKGLWIAEQARYQISNEDLTNWTIHFDPSGPHYILSQPDTFFATVEVEAVAVK